MRRYADRYEAGKLLAQALEEKVRDRNNVIVLALPRGGVPVAYEVAIALNVPLDVFVVRKLGVPGHSELAMGAIATGDVEVLNEDIVASLHIPASEIQTVINAEKQELKRREMAYRGNEVIPKLQDKTIILIDDGIATGATMKVAIKALRQYHPTKIIVAVPVAQRSFYNVLKRLADEVVCPLLPEELYAVGAWYDNFTQTEDEEVYALLRKARKPILNSQ